MLRNLTRRVFFLVASALVVGAPASGWGPNPHRVAAQIAVNHLSPATVVAVRALLGNETLPMVSTWADTVRKTPRYRHTAPWHYVNIPDGETYLTAKKNPDGDIIVALRRCEQILRDTKASRKEKAEALKFYVHFVADLHQPMHVGRASDRGGNGVRVYWFRKSFVTNLHSVWDERLFEAEKLSYTEFTDFIDRATPRQIRKWNRSGYLDWAAESMALRGGCYEFDPKRPLGYSYVDRHLPTVKLRLLEAGIRLAGKLDSIFD